MPLLLRSYFVGIFDGFFKFSSLWQVQASNGSMFLDVELPLQVCCIPRSSSSPVIFVLVFPFLFYLPFFLILFLFEWSALSLYIHIQFRCLVLITVNKDLSSSISFNTSSFDMYSVQLIFSILRHIHISKASNRVMSSFLRVHVSPQYKVTLQISVFTILFLRHLFNTPLSFSHVRVYITNYN